MSETKNSQTNCQENKPCTMASNIQMTPVTNDFTLALQKHFSEFAKKLNAKFPAVTVQNVLDTWNESSGQALTAAPEKKARGGRTRVEPSGVTCCYVFQKGVRAKQPCGANVPIAMVEGTDIPRRMCNKHVTSELKGSTGDGGDSNDDRAPTQVAATSSSPPQQVPAESKSIKIGKDKNTGRYVHPATGCVIDPATKKVTCIQMSDGKTRKLTRADVKIAESYNLNVDENAEVEGGDESDGDEELDLTK
jgi:hypothetical protein